MLPCGVQRADAPEHWPCLAPAFMAVLAGRDAKCIAAARDVLRASSQLQAAANYVWLDDCRSLESALKDSVLDLAGLR